MESVLACLSDKFGMVINLPLHYPTSMREIVHWRRHCWEGGKERGPQRTRETGRMWETERVVGREGIWRRWTKGSRKVGKERRSEER